MLKKIISGGQTGVDRAALDVALDIKFPCGGFCPKGRLAEDGTINGKYPLQEHLSESYTKRTRENVLLGDGTLIIYLQKLQGGTALTLRFCKHENKPFALIDAQLYNVARAATIALSFIRQHDIKILNVAGPRESQWPDGYQFTYHCLEMILKKYLCSI